MSRYLVNNISSHLNEKQELCDAMIALIGFRLLNNLILAICYRNYIII